LILLDFMAWLKEHTSIGLKLLCLESGAWWPRFQALGDTILLSELQDRAAQTAEQDLTRQLLEFCGGQPALIYGNSVAAGRAYTALSKLDAPIVTHVHELETSIRRYAAGWISDVLGHSTHYIACSDAVRQNLVTNYGVPHGKISAIYASIRVASDAAPLNDRERAALRSQLGLPV